MKVVTTSSPFGSAVRTGVLLALRVLDESYPRELARFLNRALSTVQKALASLENDGMVAARAVGRTRLYRLNPRVQARRELERYLDRLLETEDSLRSRAAEQRRRPRRAGKPL
jgi:DNA-binding transcriptional ArsR family regulator